MASLRKEKQGKISSPRDEIENMFKVNNFCVLQRTTCNEVCTTQPKEKDSNSLFVRSKTRW